MCDVQWLVLDMDVGVLRREPTRGAAVAWLLGHMDAAGVISRHAYGPGCYEYQVGRDGAAEGSAFIAREDVARRRSWDVDAEAVYPWGNRPYARVDEPS
jgi:hypothetical protein